MLVGDDVISGTSSTGTGNLTLTTPPKPPGGMDFDTWALANGFVSGAVIPVSYTIEEYTDATFSTVKGKEKGVGTYTVSSTKLLTRTTSQFKITGMDGSSPVFTLGSAYSVVTAANTLIYIGASAAEIRTLHPYFSTSGADSNWGVSPDGLEQAGALGAQFTITTATKGWYIPIRWSVPMLVKRCSMRVQSVSTPVSPQIWMRLYDTGSDGRPGKLLYDFSGASNYAAPTATGNFFCNNGGGGSGYWLLPGDYWFQFIGLTSSGSLTISGPSGVSGGTSPAAVRLGVTSGVPGVGFLNVTASDTGAAPDPATLTGYSLNNSSTTTIPIQGFNPS